MSLENLTQFEILFGAFGLTFVLISIVIGIRILLNYFSMKSKPMLTVGLTWIFLCSPWWGGAFSFLGLLLFNATIPEYPYLIINNVFMPLAVLCWIYSFSKLNYPNLTSILVPIFLVITILYEILVIIFLIIDPSVIGTFTGVFKLQSGILAMVFQIFAIFIAIVTGILFAKKAMSSENQKIQWKGKFLLIAFIMFTIGGLMEAIFTMNDVTLVLVRIVLIASGFSYYFGFLLPESIANKLAKE